MKLNRTNPLCPYCTAQAELVKGKRVFPHNKTISKLNFWVCFGCDARVGTHKGTTVPLGPLANEELRKYRHKSHLLFDRIWKDTNVKRSTAYTWLAKELGMKVRDCHIGMFDVAKCAKVIEVCMTKKGP